MSKPLIGFVAKSPKGQFIALIGHQIEAAGLDVINVVGHQPPQDTLEAAQQFIKNEPSLVAWYLEPVEYTGQQYWAVSSLGPNTKGT